MAIQVIQLQFIIILEKGTRYFGMTSFMTITMFYTTFHRNEKKHRLRGRGHSFILPRVNSER